MTDQEHAEPDASAQPGANREGSILDDGGIDVDARVDRARGIDLTQEPDEATRQAMEAERERRLDPNNRPESAEVDNTDRTFDPERGEFTDSETYDESEPQFSDPEDPNNPDNKR